MPPPQGSFNPLEGPADYTMTSAVHNDTYPAIDPVKTADMSGKSVFISGASRGIGKSIALSYARAGASEIAIGARSDLSSVADEVKSAAKAAGRAVPTVLPVVLDVSDRNSVDAAVREIEKAFGKLDVVINNAGILAAMAMIGKTDPEEWWRCMTVNLLGPYLVTRATLPLLLKSTLKTIITVSSVGAHLVNPSASSYQTSKLALVRLMECVAAEYAEQGVIAMSVHPGNVVTPGLNDAEEMDEQFKAIFTEKPELSADAMVFLSKERREWLGSRYINATWDLPELVSEKKKAEIVEGQLLKVRMAV